MAELREVFDMVTKQAEPDQDAWRDQERRQRRAARNRKLGAIALVATIAIGGVTYALVAKPHVGSAPATRPPSGSVAPAPTSGAQLVELDGTVSRTLPDSFLNANGLQLSPQGTAIAFVSAAGDVETIAPDGTQRRVLTEGGNTNAGDAMDHVAWSPDGTRIAFAWSRDLYVMNADGSQKRRVTNAATGTGDYYPTWSPDGSTIAFWSGSTSGRDGGPRNAEIYTIRVSGGTPTRLTTDHVSDIEASWSPDGTQLVYFHGGELWVMRADGNGPHRLAGENEGAWAPAWSPDGTRIAFLQFVGHPNGAPPLLAVRVLDVGSGKITNVGVRVGTDLNGPSWFSDTTLLINRYD